MKKLFITLLAVSLCLSMGVSAMAMSEACVVPAELPAEMAVQPQGHSCGYCHGAQYLADTEYTAWRNTGIAPECEHNDPYAKDIIQTRLVFETYTCGNCHMDEVIRTEEARWVHPK